MSPKKQQTDWLELAEAAEILGVHFATLRRWTDAGKIPHIRTLSGRRRYNRAIVEQIAYSSHQEGHPVDLAPIEIQTLDHARQNTRDLLRQPGNWAAQLNEEQRMAFRYGGQRLLGLLMQVTSHDDGEPYIIEGKRMALDYGEMCCRAGMSITDLVQAFLFFRRSILESIYSTTTLVHQRDPEGQRLFERVNDFFDLFLLSMLDRYATLKDQMMPRSPGL